MNFSFNCVKSSALVLVFLQCFHKPTQTCVPFFCEYFSISLISLGRIASV